jgi:hypothetical protein
MTEEANLANSGAQTGKKMSEEAKRKIGEANRGPLNHKWKGGVPQIIPRPTIS